jgi:hypothetical protein
MQNKPKSAVYYGILPVKFATFLTIAGFTIAGFFKSTLICNFDSFLKSSFYRIGVKKQMIQIQLNKI